jgi:hypothetical protein
MFDRQNQSKYRALTAARYAAIAELRFSGEIGKIFNKHGVRWAPGDAPSVAVGASGKP